MIGGLSPAQLIEPVTFDLIAALRYHAWRPSRPSRLPGRRRVQVATGQRRVGSGYFLPLQLEDGLGWLIRRGLPARGVVKVDWLAHALVRPRLHPRPGRNPLGGNCAANACGCGNGYPTGSETT